MCVMMPLTNALRGWRLNSLAHAPQKQTEQGGDNGSFPAEERFVCSSGADAASGESKLVCKSLIGANGRS
jgi:hypothetical protein